MKRIMVLLVVGLMLALSAPVRTAQAATDQQIGYVDLQQALNVVAEGRKAKSELERSYASKQKELDGLQTELEKMKTALEKDRLVLSADALRKQEESYRQKFVVLTQKMSAYQEELAKSENEATNSILNALRRVVQTIGETDGYSMILETSQNVVLFSPKDGDLTVEVIKAYNKLPQSERRVK